MTTAHCPRCLRFVSPLHPHRCPCDDWQHRRDRSALHRYATALALALFVGGFGLLYVGTLPDTGLGSPATSEALRAPVYPGGGPVAAPSLVPEGPSSQPAASPMTEPSADGYGSGTPVESMPAPDTATGGNPKNGQSEPGFGGPVLLAGGTTRQGVVSHMGNAPVSDDYLALPMGPGWRVRLCGPAACLTVVSTDAGPSLMMQRKPYNRIADLSVKVWETICGVDRKYGLCPANWTLLGR